MKPRKVTVYWTQEDGLPDNEVIDWEIPYTVSCDIGDGTYSRRGEREYNAEMDGEVIGVLKRRPEGEKKFIKVDTLKRSMDAFCDLLLSATGNMACEQKVYEELEQKAVEAAYEE